MTSESLLFEDDEMRYNQKSVDCSESKWKPLGWFVLDIKQNTNK